MRSWFFPLLLLTASSGLAGEVDAKIIYIINSINCCSYDDSMRGFEARVDAKILRSCLAESEDSDVLLATIRAAAPDMIAAVGSTAAEFAVQRIKDIPIVYFMVMNPKRELLDATNASGIVLNQDPGLMLGVLKDLRIAPERIATVISSDMKDAFALKQLQQQVEAEGLQLDMRIIATDLAAVAAVEEMVTSSDAIILVPDRIAISARSFRQIVELCRKNQTPLLVPTGMFVKLGGLASFVQDAPDIGHQAAAMANRILDGEAVADQQIEYPHHNTLVLNRTTVKWNRLHLPRSLERGAKMYD